MARKHAGSSWIATLLRSLRPFRIRLSKLLDPGPEPNDAFDWFISAPLRSAEALRKALQLDEQSFVGVAGQSHADAREFVVYSAIDEVQKASLWLMRMRELVQGEPVRPQEGAHERLLHTHLVEERDARTRRLLETMVTLALFTRTNEQAYFRHLLALELLDEEVSAQSDAREFWGAPTNNLRWSIEHQLTLVRMSEAEVDIARCWYLLDRRPLPDAQHLRPARIMSSARTRIREALPLMREREQLLFGFSYGASYARASESVHYSTDHRAKSVMGETDVTGHSHIGLLSFAILQRCQELMGGAAVPELDKVSELLARRDTETPIGKSFFGQAEVGDIVLANGELGQVLASTDSTYGYSTYHVSYLAERPIAGIDEDWFPAIYVRRVYSKEEFFTQMRAMIEAGGLPADIEQQMRKLRDPELHKILAASFTHMWHLGLRDYMRAQAEARHRRKARANPDGSA